MTKIDIISGFLGAGKTTLIKKLIHEAYGDEQLVLIENEFGEIGIDGGFLKQAGIAIKEMNSGCICCSLVGDFAESLKQVMDQFAPQRIIIEPSGVGKLSDVIQAIRDLNDERLYLNSYATVVDGKKAKRYQKNFGEFFQDQIIHSNTIVISRSQDMSEAQLNEVVTMLTQLNDTANIIATPWDQLSGKQILMRMEQFHDTKPTLEQELDLCPHCHHHHEGESHSHSQHKHHHEHHHEHKEDHCGCAHHHGEHHHHHHADEVFSSWGRECVHIYTKETLTNILTKLSQTSTYGTVLRAKGIVAGVDTWLYFDLVPGEFELREGDSDTIGKICVIGTELNEAALNQLFELE